MRARPAVWTLALGPVLAAACGARQAPPPPPTAAAVPPPPSPAEVEGDWALEQEVTIAHARGTNVFRAVVEKRGAVLVLVVLGPHGGRALAVTQRGREVHVERFVPIELPFPVEHMLWDVHRVWLAPPSPGAPSDGARRSRALGAGVLERFADGRLVERRFEAPEEPVRVAYTDGLAVDAPARRAAAPHARFGYVATIRTLGWTALPAL